MPERAEQGAGVDAHRRVFGDVREPVVVDPGVHQTGPRVVGDPVARHVLVGARHAVARDRDEHDRGVDLAQRLVPDAAALEAAGAHGLDHGISPSDQVEEHRAALVGAQVEGDRALAPAEVQVHERDTLDDGPGHLADVVAGRRLHLDHVRAEIGQVGGDRTGAEHRAFDDAHTGQGRSLVVLAHVGAPLARAGRHDHRIGSDTPSDSVVRRMPHHPCRAIYGGIRWVGGDHWGSPTTTQRCETMSIVTNSFHQPHRTAHAGAPLVAFSLSSPLPARAPTEGDRH